MVLSFGKEYKLTYQRLIDDLFKDSSTVKEFPFLIRYMEADLPSNTSFQIVFSVPKKRFRSAVARNRIKRLMREAFRLHKNELEESLDSKGKQLAIFMIYTGSEMPEFAFINRKTEKLISTIKKHIL